MKKKNDTKESSLQSLITKFHDILVKLIYVQINNKIYFEHGYHSLRVSNI